MTWLQTRRDQLKHRPRWPLAPLMAAAGLTPDAVSELAVRLDVDRGWLQRLKHLGLSDEQADAWATRLGWHPSLVWPEWDSGLTGAALAAVLNASQRTTCPQGHEYDALDNRGWRRCSTCHRQSARQSAKKQRNPSTPHTPTSRKEAPCPH